MATTPSLKNRQFNIRTTDSELAALRTAAAEMQMSMSDLIRQAIADRIASAAPSLR
jgi:predicted HicB family RNase H-like nuclease